MLKEYIIKLRNTQFFRSIMVLITGTVIAQLVGYAFSPLISRLFSPEEMGGFGIFQRWVVVLATIATARYEYSIPLPKREEHAVHLYRIGMFSTIITVLITLIISLLYGVFKSEKIDFLIWIFLLVLSIGFLAFFNLGSNWSIRNGDFNKISYSKIVNSLTTNASRIIFGFLNLGKWGLIISFVIGLLLSSFYFLRDLIMIGGQNKNLYARKKMLVIARIHKNFPLINLPHALTDAVRDVFVAIILVEVFSSHLFGSFDFSYRMLRIPIMLIGAAISQVLFNRIADLKNQHIAILPICKKVFFLLLLFSIVPFSMVYFFGESIFIIIFGQDWAEAGRLSEIMSPWLMVNFILSPFAIIPIVLEKQNGFFMIGLISSIVQILGFLIIPSIFKNIETTFQLVSLSQLIILSFGCYYIFKIIKEHDSTIINSISKG